MHIDIRMHMYGNTCINMSVYKIPTRVLDAQLAPLAQRLLLRSVDLCLKTTWLTL